MSVYGYIRVSTKKQSPERQRINILRACPEVSEIYEEKYTGTKIDERKVFQKLLKSVQSGDRIIFDSVSRFSRQASQGFQLYKELFNRGIDLEFLKEPYINTDNYRNALAISLPDVQEQALKPLMSGLKETLMLLAESQFKQAFEQSEKEAKDLAQRTKEGMRAKDAGEKISKAKSGQTYTTSKAEAMKPQIRKLSKDFDGFLSDKDVLKLLKLSRNTYYKYKKELSQA